MTQGQASSTDEWLNDEKVKELLQQHLDETDYRIYKALNENGRMSDTELGECVNLSRTAARRRRKKLEEEGMIDVLAVLVLQEAEFSYADVFVTFDSTIDGDELDAFIEDLQEEELIYEIDEYMGKYDLLLRVWHVSLGDVKTYLRSQLQSCEVVESYETIPITRTHKAWHKTVA